MSAPHLTCTALSWTSFPFGVLSLFVAPLRWLDLASRSLSCIHHIRFVVRDLLRAKQHVIDRATHPA